jgi:hypothetical protein
MNLKEIRARWEKAEKGPYELTHCVTPLGEPAGWSVHKKSLIVADGVHPATGELLAHCWEDIGALLKIAEAVQGVRGVFTELENEHSSWKTIDELMVDRIPGEILLINIHGDRFRPFFKSTDGDVWCGQTMGGRTFHEYSGGPEWKLLEDCNDNQ